jgi:hypothetical protein
MLIILIIICLITSNMDVVCEKDELHSSPYSFILNKGQWNNQALFLSKLNGLDVWTTEYGILFNFYKIIDETPTDLISIRKLSSKLFKYEMQNKYNI